MILRRMLACVGLAFAAAACRAVEAKPAHAGVTDSVVSRDSALARFQQSVPRVEWLSGGATSRDRLVHRFVAALEQGDTATLRSLLLTRAEFGWLYYPTTPQGLPPYNLNPQLLWFMTEGQSDKGYRTLLARRAGRPLQMLDYRCDPKSSRQGQNTVWGPCVLLRKSESDDTLQERLFAQIVQRGGRYKFLSYANKL
jgi:hypothetical protein